MNDRLEPLHLICAARCASRGKVDRHSLAARFVYIGLTAGFIRFTCNMSVTDKRGRVHFLRLSAKDVANTLSQEVTLLSKLYLLSHHWQCEAILIDI